MDALFAFSQQAAFFDELYGADGMIRYKRERVRAHMQRHLKAGDVLLEINCGTGEDAKYWSLQGYAIRATDGSAGMIARAREKFPQLQFEQLDFHQLADAPSFNYLYSNFGGLNCIPDAPECLRNAASNAGSGTRMTLVVISSFSFWESLLLFAGKFRTATRRWFSNKSHAKVEGVPFTCFYYRPSSFLKRLGREWKLLELEALCLSVPPSYIEGFDQKHARWFQRLQKLEQRYAHHPVFRGWGDYFILTVEKASAPA